MRFSTLNELFCQWSFTLALSIIDTTLNIKNIKKAKSKRGVTQSIENFL